MLHRQKTNDALNRARGARGVARKGFGRGEGGQRLAKKSLQSGKFATVVVGGARAVGIDIADVGGQELGTLQGLLHRQIGAFAIGRSGRLMVGITSVAPPRDVGKWRLPTLKSDLFVF